MTNKEIDARKEKVIGFLKQRKDWLQYILLLIILWIAVFIRKQNWHLLKDVTTGKYISLEIDSALFMRYAQYIAEHGRLYAVDTMRNYPFGLPIDFGTFTAYFVAYLYKVLHLFSSNITVEFVDVIYPTIATVIASVFLFLLVRRLFDYRVALLSTLFLVTSPVFLFRSISSDHDILGLMFVFMTLYFFVVGWQAKKKSSHIIFGILAAFSTLLGFNTAGNIKVFIMVVSLFTLIHLLLDNIKESDLYTFPMWYIITFGSLLLIGRLSILAIFTDYTAGLPATFVFLSLLFYFLLSTKPLSNLTVYKKLQTKLPKGFIVLASTLVFCFVFMVSFLGFARISGMVTGFFNIFSKALVFNRWASTVSENRRVFVNEWFNSFGLMIILLFIIGLIILVYKLVKDLKDYKKLFFVYSISVLAFTFSRYSQDSVLNGSNFISNFMFYGSVALVIVYTIYYYLSNYYKSFKTGTKFSINLNWKYTFALVIALVNVVGGTTAVRLFFELAPFVVILTSFSLIILLDYFLTLKTKVLKYAGVLLLVLILFNPLSFAKGIVLKDINSSHDQVKYMGPSYNQQWQETGKWVRENTPNDSVFIHWWDYGYWVQEGFERATVTDGGNRIWWWNYLTARNVLTAPRDDDSLKFLYAHNVSHLLVVPEEIGKYPAYSLIGSDKNLDRYSYISFMGFDNSQSKETRNGSLLVYPGGVGLDEDFIHAGNIYPSGTIVAAVLVSVDKVLDEQDNVVDNIINQPIMILFQNGNMQQFSMKCIFVDKLYTFDDYDYGGCVRIIPTIKNDQVNNIGAIIFMSERVADSLFARLYILEEESDYFKLVYTDANKVPLALYNDRQIGPMKIWRVNYPEELSVNQTEHEYYNFIGVPDQSLLDF